LTVLPKPLPAACSTCGHLRTPDWDARFPYSCDAFPGGITDEAAMQVQLTGHRRPIEGDGGVTWAPFRPGLEPL